MRELQQELALDPELSAIIAKSSFSQEPLTDSGIIRLDAYYEASIQFLHRERYLLRMGVFEDDPAFLTEIWTRMFLNNPAAIAWWETKKPALSPDLIELVDNALSAESARVESVQLHQLRERIGAGR